MNLTPGNHPTPDPEFIELVQRVLDHEASLDDIARLNAILPQDPAALRYFVKMRRLNAALEDEFGARSIELDSIADRLVTFPMGDTPEGRRRASSVSKAPRLWAAAAVLMLLVSLGSFWGAKWLFERPAFEIVASFNTGASVPESGSWLNHGDRLAIDQGAVELRAADGNLLTLEGPGELVIGDPQTLTLNSGKLWAVIEGDPVRIRTRQGEVTDLGTTFGIDQKSSDATRIDVFDGSVRLGHPADESRFADAAAGKSLVTQSGQWPPEKAEADASRYTAGLRSPIGFTFVKSKSEAARVTSALPFGAQWTPVSTPSGKVEPRGTSFEIAWIGTSLFSAGAEQSAEATVFHTHLCGVAWKGGYSELHQEAARLGLPDESYGLVMQLRGMSAWLAEVGAKSYRVTVLRNSAVPNVGFLPVTAHAGMPSETSYLAILQIWNDDYQSADFPDAPTGIGARATGVFNKAFTVDLLTLTLPPEDAAGVLRPNISGIIVTPVF